MVAGIVRIRQEIACGLPIVCRGRLGNPTLGPLDKPLRVEDPDATGGHGSIMYADWTSGFPDRKEAAPRVEPIVNNASDWMQSCVENPRPYTQYTKGHARKDYGFGG
eukprot:10979992-Alexandrium_andersonii.AAC.1